MRRIEFVQWLARGGRLIWVGRVVAGAARGKGRRLWSATERALFGAIDPDERRKGPSLPDEGKTR